MTKDISWFGSWSNSSTLNVNLNNIKHEGMLRTIYSSITICKHKTRANSPPNLLQPLFSNIQLHVFSRTHDDVHELFYD